MARLFAVRHHVDELYLFGYMASGEATADSDVGFVCYRLNQASMYGHYARLRATDFFLETERKDFRMFSLQKRPQPLMSGLLRTLVEA